MDVPTNHFKRAIKAGPLADRPLVQPRQQHLGRDRGRLGLRLAAARHRALAQRAADGLQPAAGGDGEHGAADRPAALERQGDDQAVPRRRGADAADPDVQTAEEAEQAVASTRYPPRGVRGFASASRASRFGRVKDYHTRCEEEICVLVQIETKQGLDNLEAIAGVEGVDGVFIGPGDLSAGLGLSRRPGQPGHPPGARRRDRGGSRPPARRRAS